MRLRLPGPIVLGGGTACFIDPPGDGPTAAGVARYLAWYPLCAGHLRGCRTV